nr:immunoglobulin light chain junction region [Macaca mulatta]
DYYCQSYDSSLGDQLF